jgi:SAM-dependent methyltransferase
MPQTTAFDRHPLDYEAWFERHAAAYASEVAALRELWPADGEGVDIGAGAGHFTAALGIRCAVEPSAAMRQRALRRGIRAVGGVAERLPLAAGSFDAALMVTTLSFVNDPAASLLEVRRVLRPRGSVVVAIIDRDSPLGQSYERRRATSTFYQGARFLTPGEVTALLSQAGFSRLAYRQTLFSDPDHMAAPDPVTAGYGDGAFVVIRGQRQRAPAC